MLSFKKPNRDKEIWVNVSNRTVIRVLVMIAVALLLLLALRKALHALVLIFTAFFLTLALNAPVHWVAEHIPGRKKGSRAIGTAISFLIVVIILGGFIALIIPPLTRQTEKFIKAAPSLVSDVRDQKSNLGNLVRKYKLQGEVNSLSTQLSDR